MIGISEHVFPMQVPRQVPGHVPGQDRLRERFVSLGGFVTKLTLSPRNYCGCRRK
jgi:hypothetical protein